MLDYEILSDVGVLLVKPEEPRAFNRCPKSACQQTDKETMFSRVTIPNGFPTRVARIPQLDSPG